MANEISKDVQRLDWYDNAISWETRPAETTPEGFLVARVPVTSIGVFQYRNDDGTTRRELRLPEEVFAPESMDSLKCKPLTLNHPDVKIVTPENIGELQVGSVGSDVTGDSYRVYVTLSATKQDAISAIRAGTNRGLSCGYNCDIEWTSGTWLGMAYDCIQRNIRYNHVALVPAGRAGDDAQIRMDSAGVLCDPLKNFNEKENDMALQTIHLDGADFQAEPHVIAALDKAVARADAAEKELAQLRADSKVAGENAEKEKATITAERDTFKERLDAMEKEMPGKIEAAVKARLDIVGKATAAGVEVRDDMADVDIKKAVVMKFFPHANLDGQKEDYINARFDCACEQAAKEAEDTSRQDAADHVAATPGIKTAQERLEEAKRNYNARLDSAWQDDNPNK